MKIPGWPVLLLGLCAATPALADDRPLCPDRPGLGTPACTVEPGKIVAEVGLGDWTSDRDSQSRTDDIVMGDALVRVGVADHLEAQIGWTAFGHERVRDRATGTVEKDSGVGDVTLALRRNLASPDGSGFSVAVMPYATLPVGSSPVSAGDWGAGLIVPVSFDLTDSVSLALTPEVDAAVDEDGTGRHLAYGSVLGLGIDLSQSLQTTLEVQATRDRDPAGHHSDFLAGLSLAWQPKQNLQLDTGIVAGLDASAPDIELYAGIARSF